MSAMTADQTRTLTRGMTRGLTGLGGSGGGTPEEEDTNLTLRNTGSQATTLIDYSPDAMSNDALDRNRTWARTTHVSDEGTSFAYVQSAVRAANVVTVTLVGAPDYNIATGHTKFCATFLLDPSFNADHADITVTSQTVFTYANTGSNATARTGHYHDIPAAFVNHIELHTNGQPKADFAATISRAFGSSSEIPSLVGTYTGNFPYTGTYPTVALAGGGAGGAFVGYTPGDQTFTVTVNAAQSGNIDLIFTGVPTDGSFVKPTFIRTVDNPAADTFLRPDYSAAMGARYKTIRFMDLPRSNNNAYLISAATRPKFQCGKGMPVEQCVQMANECSADMWYCLPRMADSTYVDAIATYIHANLAVGRCCYFEWDNEPWNSVFLQFFWLFSQARAIIKGASNGYHGVTEITGISRLANVVTVSMSRAPTFASGATVAVETPDATFNTSGATATVVGNSFTYPLAGANGAASGIGTVLVIGDTTQSVVSGGTTDLSVIRARLHVKHTYDMSQRLLAIFGALNVRARPVMQWAMVDTGQYGMMRDNMLPWALTTYGATADWLYAIAGAPYCYSNAAANVAAIVSSVTASMDDNMNHMQQYMWLALKYGVKFVTYEAGPDLSQVPSEATVDAAFSSASYYTLNKDLADRIGAMCHLNMWYYSMSARWAGAAGSLSWGSHVLFSDVGAIGASTGSAQRQKAIDAALQGAFPVAEIPYQMPGTIKYASTDWTVRDEADDEGGSSKVNGMYSLNSDSRYVEDAFYAPAAGVFAMTIWGVVEVGGGANAVRIYLEEVLKGTHALATGTLAGVAAGGLASPTTFALTIPAAGWYRIRVRAPASTPTGCGVSKIVAV